MRTAGLLLRTCCLLACWLVWAVPAWAAPLVSPTELNTLAQAGGVRIVDVREAQAYALQHLPGAVSAPYFTRWRGPPSNPGLVPPLKDLTALVQELGLTPDTRTVLVYTGVDSARLLDIYDRAHPRA